MYFKAINKNFWTEKRVLITGHTGFKGSWLSVVLLSLGAKVSGFSLDDEDKGINLYDSLNIQKDLNHYSGNICNLKDLEECIISEKPDFIFHLAAQSLVRESYLRPIETWNVNTIGSINVIEAAKNKLDQCTLVMITTDKVYENNEWVYGYREIDHLGGHDPYSSSKAAAELAIKTWRMCFSNQDNCQLKISSARAGNVIGGGDWAKDRIIPDAIRALSANEIIKVRNKKSTRPWQHVLEPLFGYILLAQNMYESKKNSIFESAFNFGPQVNSHRSVEDLINEILKTWDGNWIQINEEQINMHEAAKLNLVIDKSINFLGWQPSWDFCKTVERTINWYKFFYSDSKNPLEYCLKDINAYLDED